MALRRGGTPLGGIPSLEASNQAQIDDLVQRNHSLEHLNKKLSAQIASEEARSKAAVLEIQRHWEENQQQWKEGCEDVLTSYRIMQKRVEVELERERTATIREMKITREEKLQRLQRDYKIKLFQMREEELERRLEEVEEEKVRLMDGNGMVVRKMKEKCAEYLIKLRDTEEVLALSEQEKDKKEALLNKLHETRANVEANAESLKSKLERTKLQLDGAETKNAELERQNDEYKRTNAELARQLGKWQSLETKEGEAAETQRKHRIALELELRDLKETSEKQAQADAAELAREKRRVEKAKDIVQQWQVSSQYQCFASEEYQKEAADAEKQLAKALKQVDKLKSELEEERARVRPPSPEVCVVSKRQAVTKPATAESDQEAEQPTPPRRGKSASVKPPSKRPPAQPAAQSSKTIDKKDTKPHPRTARKSTGGRPPSPIAINQTEDKTSDIEETVDPIEDRDSAEDRVVPRKTRKAKGKAKAVEVEVDVDDEDSTPAAAPSPPPKKKGKRKQRSRAGSKQPAAREEEREGDMEGDVIQKKKKRKINLFANAGDMAPFNFTTNVMDDGLGIPSVLSPIRPDETVPSRSTASLVGSIGSLMKFPFGGRRQ
ncbi:hypothetical protein B0H34DRAFT_667011 [Crassisporium funariophilum]|nr:hypothetical protein B0H34DRAFT_667011 [Crassisporium funariophilum]